MEFAILLPLLAFGFVLAIDWCRIFYVAHTLEDCARNGAYAACGIAYQERNLTSEQRVTRGQTEAVKGGTNLSPPLAATDVSVSVSGDTVTVTVTYNFATVANFPLVGGSWPLVRTVQMRINP